MIFLSGLSLGSDLRWNQESSWSPQDVLQTGGREDDVGKTTDFVSPEQTGDVSSKVAVESRVEVSDWTENDPGETLGE